MLSAVQNRSLPLFFYDVFMPKNPVFLLLTGKLGPFFADKTENKEKLAKE